MRRLLLCLLSCLASLTGHAQDALLQGKPFHRADLPVRWNASSNPWPPSLWTYRVTPTNFAPGIILNLMELGPFAESDKATPPGGPDPRRLYFVSRDKSKTLAIAPMVRSAEFEDHDAENISTIGQTPDTNEVTRLATAILSKLGISSSELATEPHRDDLRVWRTQREGTLFTNNTLVTNIQSRGIVFSRMVDGVVVRGLRTSVCRIEYSHAGKLLRLSLLWPGWERVKEYATVSPQTIVRWIHEGKAVVRSLPPGVEAVAWQRVNALTITEAEAVYSGDAKNVLHAKIEPYAALNVLIETEETNMQAEIHCPLIDQSN